MPTIPGLKAVLKREFWDPLREQGFTDGKVRTRWRRWSEGIDAVEVRRVGTRFAGMIDSTPGSFSVTAGLWLRWGDSSTTWVPSEGEFPELPDCQLRFCVGNTLRQRLPRFRQDSSTIWLVSQDGSNAVECVQDAWRQVAEHALPWLEKMRDPEYVRWQISQRELDIGPAGWGGPESPSRRRWREAVERRLSEKKK